MSVTQAQRYTRNRPCPICGGWERLPRGQGRRCAGFLSDDGDWARCERPELAGELVADSRTTPPTYAHRLVGDCRCGGEHGAPPVANNGHARGPVPAGVPVSSSVPRYSTSYRVCGLDGELVALHRRMEMPDGSKTFAWARPDGESGLGGMPAAGLPLYRSEMLSGLPASAAVVLVEGEKAGDALGRMLEGRRVAVVATVTGAATTPADEVLGALVGRRVVLWPDNDEPGLQHMRRIASRLLALGCERVVVVKWPQAPAHGDAADYAPHHSLEELASLLKGAEPFRAEPSQVVQPVDESQREPSFSELAAMMGDAFEYPPEGGAVPGERVLELVPASAVRLRAVKWLEAGRVPLGALTLLGGREGIGKTLLWVDLAARVTRGDLDGACLGSPHGVIVAATEDSWEMTIAPRLVAARADLDKVFRVNVTWDDNVSSLSLPQDLPALEAKVHAGGVVLVVLDPLLSRLSARLDTHVDAQVRMALEPMVALADRAGASVLGVIHVNKTSTTDPLTSLMGSRAFAAVARSVLYMVEDPDDKETRLVGIPKNNLGRSDLPTRSCKIEGVKVGVDDEGEDIWAGRLTWTQDRPESIAEVLEASAATAEVRSATSEAADWLSDFLEQAGGSAPSADAKRLGKAAEHSVDALKRACQRLQIHVSAEGFPRRTIWTLPESLARTHAREHTPTTPTAPTAPTGTGRPSPTTTTSTGLQSAQSAQLVQSEIAPARAHEKAPSPPTTSSPGDQGANGVAAASPLPEPSAAGRLAHAGVAPGDEPETLPPGRGYECDHCRKPGPVFKVGPHELCLACVEERRQKVAGKVVSGAVAVPPAVEVEL